VVRCPRDMNAFEFAVVAGLRAAQLRRGCTPRVERSETDAVTAQHEVAQRKVRREAAVPVPLPNAR
jgi:DNA-directed RNA polymerase subunit K/omega